MSVTFTLSESDYDRLLIMMGYAVGAAIQQDRKLAHSFIELVNIVNKDNPNFIPYELPKGPHENQPPS